MNSEITIALVVLVTVAAHIAIYRWVKFKIQEGVILRFLRDAGEGGTLDYYHADVIAGKTEITAERVGVVCRKSVEIHSDPEVGNGWRAN